MSKSDKEMLCFVLAPFVGLFVGVLGFVIFLKPPIDAKAQAVHLEQNPPIPALPEVVPLVRPLNKEKMVEIYERAFFECNTQYHMSVEERHKFAMGAVQTAPSRYNQLMKEIAKHDEN